MSNTSVSPSQSAIIWNSDNSPTWNLTETSAYPVSLRNIPVYVYMSPYTADELKAVLKKAVSGYKREKRDVEIVREDRDIYTPLCDDHFVKLGNSTGTPEQQRTFLDRHPELKPGIVEFSFGGLQLDKPENEDDTDSVLDISADLSGAVKVYQELYDDATDEVVRVNMVHEHSHPTEAQYRQYRNARRSKFLRKSTLWTITEQHGTLETLYDAVVQSVFGAAVDGKPCDAKTKQDWISGIPLWHKLWVVDQIFGEIVEKNA